MVLDHFPPDTGQIGRLPGEHILVRPQEGDERAFLLRRKAGADGEGRTRTAAIDRHLLCFGAVLREQLLLPHRSGLQRFGPVPGAWA
jgi:hypothetical protein